MNTPVTFMPKLYISGPMRGVPEDNYPAFTEAAKHLRANGYQVENPAEHFGGDRGLPRHKYLAVDVLSLMGCQAIVLLRGWGGSEGSRLEAQIGLYRGLNFFRYAPTIGLRIANRHEIEEVLNRD